MTSSLLWFRELIPIRPRKTLDKLQQLAASTMQTSSAVDLPEIEVDDFWATSQSTLDKVAEAKRKAAIEKRKAAKAKRLQALATAPTGVIQAYAHQQVLANSWGEGDFTCLVNLWNKESGWDPKAEKYFFRCIWNPPSLFPAIRWQRPVRTGRVIIACKSTGGISYIAASYGTPCAAWSHSQAHNFY